MATVAELRMDVDSRPVKNAGKDLDQLSSKAERAERSAVKLGDGSRRASGGVAQLANEASRGGKSVSGLDYSMGRAIAKFAGFAAGILSVAAAVGALRSGLAAADDFRALDNRIKLVTDSAEEFAKVQSGLIDVSRRTFASIEGTVQAYQRMAGATDRLGISQDRLLGISETVNKAVALSGATSQAAEASLIQFGQALSNNFQASSQEINSLNEQVFALSDAIARGITKVTGIETFRSDLKRMAEDGKLSSELVIRALEAVKDETDATFNGLDRTFAQTAQRLKTNAQIIAKEAFGPLLSIKIDFYTKVAEALEDPRVIQAAQKFGATLVDIARMVERNAGAIGKAFQGIAISVASLTSVKIVQFVVGAVASLREWYAATVALSTAKVAATAAEMQFNTAIASGSAIALESVAAQRARAAFAVEGARADQAAALAKIADIKAAQGQIAANLELISVQRAQAVSQLELARGITIATGLRNQQSVAEANLARSMAAGLATRKAMASIEAEIAAAQTAHTAATTRLAAAETAYAASSTAVVARVGFFSRALAQARAGLVGIGAIIAANPLGVLIVGLAASVAAIVTFRDQITRALTPFKSFKDLASEAAPVFRGAFAIIAEASRELLGIISSIEERFRSLISSGRKAQADRVGLLERMAKIARDTSPFPNAIPNAVNYLGERGRREIANDNARAAQSQRSIDNVARAVSIGLPQGLDAEIEGVAGALENAGNMALAYQRNLAKAALETKNIGASSKKPLGDVQKSLTDAVAQARRLFEAAQGGKLRFEEVTKLIEIEKAAIAAVEKAKSAGEELSLSTAKSLETNRRNLLDSAKALLEAEERLRESAKKKSGQLADEIGKTIDRSIDDSPGNVSFNGLNAREIQQSAILFGKTIQEQLDFLSSDATIGIDADTLLEMQKRIKEAADYHAREVRDALNEGATQFRRALQNTFGTIFDDLLFNGGKGIGDLFRSGLRDIGNKVFSEPLSKFLSGEGSLFGNLKNSFKDLTAGFAKAGKSVAGSISSSLAGAGATLGAALGGALAGFGVGNGLGDLLGLTRGSTGRRTLTGAATGAGVGAAVGSIVPGIGTAIGAAVGAIAGAIGGALSGLFGRKTATGVVDIASGTISGTKNSKKEGGERNERRDAILTSVSEAAKALADALGATITRGIQLQVDAGKKSITTTLKDQFGRTLGTTTSAKDDVEGAFKAALKLILDKAFSGGNQTLKDFATSALAAGRSLEEVITVLQVLKQASDTGVKALSDYALVAAKAGRSADQIAQGVNALNSVLDLTNTPLSEIAEQLKKIDDAVDPVIKDLQSLGQSITSIAQIGKDAATALGQNFIQGIRDLNIDLQNSVFGQFNKLLEEIRQREEDARLLLNRGAITQQQFGFVQSTGGLQVSKFFEGLGADDKESLADFLGLLKTASGDVAVARVKLEEQFNYLIDNVEETARGFEEAARIFERLAQNLTQTADSIRTEFSGLTPRDNTVTLQGRAQTLLNQARDTTATTQSRQSALEALPQVVNALVQSARQAFGGTSQFASIRDFGLSALDEGASIADALAKFNDQQAIAAREDVKILTDIRELLNDDRQLSTLQNILDEGRLTNTLIAQQLQTFLTLMSTAGSNLNQITAEQLQAAAAAYLAQQQSTIAQQTPAPASAGTPAAAPAFSTPDQQLAQALADQAAATDKNSNAIVRMAQEIDDLAVEIRRYVLKQVA